jgi:hypothetical protein
MPRSTSPSIRKPRMLLKSEKNSPMILRRIPAPRGED